MYTRSSRVARTSIPSNEGSAMKIKVKVDEAGNAYVGVIDPGSGDHKKSVAVNKCQEVVLSLPDVHSESGVEIGDVVSTEVEKPAEAPQEPAPADGGGEGDQSASAPAESERGLPAGLGIGRMVIYRSRTGDYDCPAVVTATIETLNPKGVELGHVPPLSGSSNVHLTVLTPGKPGMRRDAGDFKEESEHGRSENVAGTYQEWDIPLCSADNDPEPGSWRWPERK